MDACSNIIRFYYHSILIGATLLLYAFTCTKAYQIGVITPPPSLTIQATTQITNNISGEFSNLTASITSSSSSSSDNNNNNYNGINTQGQPIPLVRLPSNTLLKYTAYKDVSILHFRIPIDTRTALFSFKAYEETKSAFQRDCQPRDVTLHLKAGSYPVISPENITFPRHFLSAEQRFEIHTLQFKSDGGTRRLSIDGPHPGNWFAVAFISWTEPTIERIQQQGLTASCETLLTSEMSVIKIQPIILNNGIKNINKLINNSTEPISYKFFIPLNIDRVTLKFTLFNSCMECLNNINLNIQANSLPTIANYLQNAIIYANQTGIIKLDFYPQINSWHYIDIEFIQQQQQQQQKLHQTYSNNNDEKITTTTTPAPPTPPSPSSSNESIYQLDFSIELFYHETIVIDDDEVGVDEADGEDDPNSSNYSQNDEDNGTINDTDEYNENPLANRIFDLYPLLRQTYREFFMFDYDLLPDTNGTVPTSLNLTGGTPSLFKFGVGDVYDIGGTLSFAVAMKQVLKSDGFYDATGNLNVGSQTSPHGAVAEKLVSEGKTDESKGVKTNQSIIICMRLGEPGIPMWPDKCVYGRHVLAAASVINNTDTDTSTGLVHVPFPESGHWYVTMGLFCHGSTETMTVAERNADEMTAARVTIIESVKEFIKKHIYVLNDIKAPCPCSTRWEFYRDCVPIEKCLVHHLNETETLKVKECMMDSKCTAKYKEMTKKFEVHHKAVTEQSVNNNIGVTADSTCNASVVFTISSSPCVAGRCGRYGRCYHYMSGGFVFSTCLCIKGYRGWDCTEDSQVPSSFSILIASLLLTLSNLLFIPSIYIAVRRKFYTEAVIYFFAMFFSSFYHACDSGEDEYSFCLVKIGVLQFSDFYCGLLAIWVTLIAMANLRTTFISLLHMFGAIILAFGTELNKQSLWVFLGPALTGICLISVSWGMRCRKTRKCFPSQNYLAVYLPIGTVLVMVGLVCFAFLQTKQNYHIVHSIWHMVMALSLLCLLPNRKTFLPKC